MLKFVTGLLLGASLATAGAQSVYITDAYGRMQSVVAETLPDGRVLFHAKCKDDK